MARFGMVENSAILVGTSLYSCVLHVMQVFRKNNWEINEKKRMAIRH